MNQNNNYTVPIYNCPPAFGGRYRFLFLGFLFPIFHYVIMLMVQIVVTLFQSFRLAFQMGASVSEAELETKLLAFLTEYSDVLSIVSAVLTVLLAFLVYLLISSRIKNRQLTPPSVKTYFSLHKIRLGLVGKLVLLAFFFYHFVLGFLNLVGFLAPNLMESYNDAAQSVDTGTSVFSLVMSFFALVIAAPITEELIYRNMAIANMRSRMPAVGAVFVSSIVFGFFHGNLVWMLYAGGLGLLFGFLYVKSESIYVSLVVHTVFNLIGFVYSVLSNFANESMVSVINVVSFCLILISLVGAPLVFLWVWFGLSKKDKPIQ